MQYFNSKNVSRIEKRSTIMSMKKQILDDILQMSSYRASDMFAAVCNNERFIQAVQKMLVASLEFKDLLHSTMKTALEQLNIASREDIEKISNNQFSVEDRLLAIEETLERIEAKLDLVNQSEKVVKKSKKTKAEKNS